MCRGCLFVKVDIPSGGDIDGCLKEDIIEELRSKGEFGTFIGKGTYMYSEFTEKGRMVLDHEMAMLDEKHCKEIFNQPQSKDSEEFDAQSKAFWKARDRAYDSYKQYLYDRMMRAEKLPLSKVRELYAIKKRQSLKPAGSKQLITFLEASA